MIIFFTIIVVWLLFRSASASRRTNRLLAYHPAIAEGVRREKRTKAILTVLVLAFIAGSHLFVKDEPNSEPATPAPVTQPQNPVRTDGHHRFNRNDWRYNSPEDWVSK